MGEIDISKLTKEAESGNGCGISAAIAQMPFEESLRTLKAIVEQDKVNRGNDKSLPEVQMYVNGGLVGARAVLAIDGGSWSTPEEIATDRLSFAAASMGERSQTCSNKH